MAFGVFHGEIIGNLGADPEMTFTPQGTQRTTFRVGVTPPSREKTTYWVKVTTWGKLAESANNRLSKGAHIWVIGRLSLEHWKNRQGEEQTTLALNADDWNRLDKDAPAERVEEDVTFEETALDATAGHPLSTPATPSMDF